MTVRIVDEGTLSVANGATAVTGSGTAWSTLLDRNTMIWIGDEPFPAIVTSRKVRATDTDPESEPAGTFVEDAALTLRYAWHGTTAVDESYKAVVYESHAELNEALARLLADLSTRGLVGGGFGAPPATETRDKYIWVNWTTGVITQRQAGQHVVIAGASKFVRVRVVDTAGGAPTTDYEDSDTIDGVTLAENDIVLRAAAGDPELNGPYVVPASGAASRHDSFDAYDDLPGTYFSVMEGTAKADTLWRVTSNKGGGTIDSDPVAISEFIAGGRELLTANRTYYVRTDGSDSNTGLADTAGGAFLTLQKAMDVIAGGLDLGTYDVTVTVRAGTYTGNLSFKSYRATSGVVKFEGDTTTPSNVLISMTSANCITNLDGVAGAFRINGFKLATTTSGIGLAVTGSGMHVLFGQIDFGTCATYHCQISRKATAIMSHDCFVSGGSLIGFWATRQALLIINGRTITYSNSPAYGARNFNASEQGFLDAYSMTFTNGATVTGPRYLVDGLGGVFTNGGGASYVPGNSAGSATNGGVYY